MLLNNPIIIKQNKIQQQFDSIKNNINIHARIKKHYLQDNVLYVNMYIDINQFRQWLKNNFSEGLINIRSLWYLFLDYIKNIFDYGYHFNNVMNINRFLKKNNNYLSSLDNIIKDLPYNICAAADIYKPEIANDKNSFIFNIITEAYRKEEEIDNDIQNSILINNNEDVEEDDENEIEIEEEIKVETKEEEMNRLIKEYKENGCCHAHIAYEVMKQNQNQLDNLTFIKSIELTPKIIKHEKNNKIISLLWSISKTQFLYNFSLFRNDNLNQVWIDFKSDFMNNFSQYKCINKKCMDDYLVSINQQFHKEINGIYNVDISKENNVKFWTKIQVF